MQQTRRLINQPLTESADCGSPLILGRSFKGGETMEFLKSLSPEKRKKINLGLLIFAGIQFFLVFAIQVFSSDPLPSKKLADLPREPLKREIAPMPSIVKKPAVGVAKARSFGKQTKKNIKSKQAGSSKKLPPQKIGKHAQKNGPLSQRMAKAGGSKSEVDIQ